MVRQSLYVAFLAAFATPLVSAHAAEVHRCPASSTQTIPSPGDPGIVLADGLELVAVQVTGPFRAPWSFGFLPDGSFLVTERSGHLQHARPGADHKEVTGIPSVLYELHGGLLDVAIDPEFSTNGLIYFSYLQGSIEASTMRVMRARYDEETETLADQQVIFESTPGNKTDQIGGRIALSGDGYLFLTLGDLWQPERAQRFQTTIHLSTRRARLRRYGATAIAIRKDLQSTAPLERCGRPNTDRKAEMSSISCYAAEITAGLLPPTAPTTWASPSR